MSSITNSATTSTVRSLLNTKAVLEDLEGSEEYDAQQMSGPFKTELGE